MGGLASVLTTIWVHAWASNISSTVVPKNRAARSASGSEGVPADFDRVDRSTRHSEPLGQLSPREVSGLGLTVLQVDKGFDIATLTGQPTQRLDVA